MELLRNRSAFDVPLQSGVPVFAANEQPATEARATGTPYLDTGSSPSGEGIRSPSTAPEIPVEELRRLARTTLPLAKA